MSSIQQPTFIDIFKVFLLGSLWSTSYIFMKILADLKIDPYSIVFFRCLFGTICMSLFMFYYKISIPKLKTDRINILIIATIGTAFPFFLLSYASLKVEASTITIINALNPLFALIFAYFFRKEECITLYKLVGIIIGFLGVALIFGEDALLDESRFLYKFAAICATCCYVIGSNYIRKVSKEVSIFNLVFWSLFLATCFSSIFFFFFAKQTVYIWEWNLESFLCILYLGVFPTAIGWFARFKLVSQFGYTFVSNVGFVIPIVGVFLSVVVLKEQLQLVAIISFFLIMFGMIIGNKKI